jgi:hypothetical protein
MIGPKAASIRDVPSGCPANNAARMKTVQGRT